MYRALLILLLLRHVCTCMQQELYEQYWYIRNSSTYQVQLWYNTLLPYCSWRQYQVQLWYNTLLQ